MAAVLRRMLRYGKRELGTEDLEEILKKLRVDEGLTDRQLAKKFNCTVPAVRHWLKSFGLLRPRMRFPEKVVSMGYRDLKSFFRKSAREKKTLTRLAEETGYCRATVSLWRSRAFSDDS